MIIAGVLRPFSPIDQAEYWDMSLGRPMRANMGPTSIPIYWSAPM